MAQDTQVIIVGAAVAGGALANALGSLGIRTLVLEKGAERDNSTRGDILHPSTLAFLDRWGVLEPMFEDGALPITTIACSHRTLGRLATYAVPAQGDSRTGRSIAIPHDRIEAVLKETGARWPTVEVEHARVAGLLWQDGRVVGVRADTSAGERQWRAPLVVGCDGSQSLIRRETGTSVNRKPYDHELLYIAADGPTDPPGAMHFCIDERGVMMVASRPRQRMRIAVAFDKGARGDLLRQLDPALHDYVLSRIPWLTEAHIPRETAHLYPLSRQLAGRFSGPGWALVGDAAHTTHPTGATGMNLAITGAARLSDQVAPLFAEDASTSSPRAREALDLALGRYEAERQPASRAAIEQNDRQSQRIWSGDLYKDPAAYAASVDPLAAWGVGGAGWGQNPAALAASGPSDGA